jgi:arginyl-tRNA synthetase
MSKFTSNFLLKFDFINKIQQIEPDAIWDLCLDDRYGDITTNWAMLNAGIQKSNPRDLASSFIERILNLGLDEVESAEVAGPGFINVKLKDESLKLAWLTDFKSEKPTNMVIEYGHANLFKTPHVGHFYNYLVGDTYADFFENLGHKVFRTSYRSDIGLNCTAAVYGWRLIGRPMSNSLKEQGDIVQRSYETGATLLKTDAKAMEEIKNLNAKIYNQDEAELEDYLVLKNYSLGYLSYLHETLGIKFYDDILESRVVDAAKKICQDAKNEGVLEESDGALIYKGEKNGLHTRVFVNSFGNPTYEGKELALAKYYDETIPEHDIHLVIANAEIKEYFKVVKKVLEFVFPALAPKCTFLPTGHLSPTTKKMSSRDGGTMDGLALYDIVYELVSESDKKGEMDDASKRLVTLSALKYVFVSKNIDQNQILDLDKAANLHGATGPYLQYTLKRLSGILAKIDGLENEVDLDNIDLSRTRKLAKKKIELDLATQKSEFEMNIAEFCAKLFEFANLINVWYEESNVLKAEGDDKLRLINETILLHTKLTGYLKLLGIVEPLKM